VLLRVAAIELLGPEGEVGAKPIQCLLPPAGALLFVRLRVILALATAGQRRGTGGDVALISEARVRSAS
jgi:hypothetical protein